VFELSFWCGRICRDDSQKHNLALCVSKDQEQKDETSGSRFYLSVKIVHQNRKFDVVYVDYYALYHVLFVANKIAPNTILLIYVHERIVLTLVVVHVNILQVDRGYLVLTIQRERDGDQVVDLDGRLGGCEFKVEGDRGVTVSRDHVFCGLVVHPLGIQGQVASKMVWFFSHVRP
jgi:hypothetical protein